MIIETIAAFSHTLNIKEKIFPAKKEIAVSETELAMKERYCSIFLEYSSSGCSSPFPEKLELVLARKSEFTIPIRHLDWVVDSSHLEPIRLLNFDMPNLLTVPLKGLLLEISLEGVMSSQISDRLRGKHLMEVLGSLALQCIYADGSRKFVKAPPALVESIFNSYS